MTHQRVLGQHSGIVAEAKPSLETCVDKRVQTLQHQRLVLRSIGKICIVEVVPQHPAFAGPTEKEAGPHPIAIRSGRQTQHIM